MVRGTTSVCDQKEGNGLFKFLKRKRVSPLPWVFVLSAKISMFDVITGLSEGDVKNLPGQALPLHEAAGCGLRGSRPGLIAVFVIQLFFLERQSFSATLLWHSGTWSFTV